MQNKYRALNVHLLVLKRRMYNKRSWEKYNKSRSSSSIIFTTPFCPPPATSEHQWCTPCVAYRDKPWSIAGEIWPLLPSRWFTIDWLRHRGFFDREPEIAWPAGRFPVSAEKKTAGSPEHEPSPCAAFDFPGGGSSNFTGAILCGRYLARAPSIIKRSRSRL